MEVIEKEELVDVAIVVTRYFGGILLGTGGLARAYTQGAKLAIAATQILNMTPCYRVNITLDYDLYGKVQYILPQYTVTVLNTDFTENVSMEIILPTENFDGLNKKITEISSATVVPEIIGEKFFSI